KTSKELSNLIEAKTGEYDNIHIVAHSLGGLIAQQALYHSYNENQKQGDSYIYLDKVRKVILVGTPNEGSPVAGVYKNLFVKMVNEETEYPLFNINSRVMDDLVKGVITPRIPGVDYYVIAGTRIDEVNMLFFKVSKEKLFGEYEKADGILTTKSAQHVGDGYINDKCSNYWEINLTHGELVSHPVARKVIENIIAKDILKIETLLGNSRYFELNIGSCDSEDTYVLIGKKIREEEIEDATFCRCGNGYCGIGENAYNCPEDCAVFLSIAKIYSPYLFYTILILLMLFGCYEAAKKIGMIYYAKKKAKPDELKRKFDKLIAITDHYIKTKSIVNAQTSHSNLRRILLILQYHISKKELRNYKLKLKKLYSIIK
ncbi:MAG: hypothetical protein KAU20_06580, partial [Nanoarchaeota archaeon]|nr:hypothetical protein [Nanoarchaeota archaeon]